MSEIKPVNTPFKILVADDEQSLDELFKKVFRKQICSGRYKFSFAKTGEQALKKIHAEHHDLILVDIQMPDLNGFDLLQQIEQQRIDIQAIIFSAYENIEYLKNAIEAKVCDYIVKPNFDELEKSIEKTLFSKTKTNVLKEDNFQNERVYLGTVYQLATKLPPSLQYHLVCRLLANFKREQFKDLQESLPSLIVTAQKKQEMLEESLLQLLEKEKSRIELRVETRRLKTSQEVRHYQYYYLRWPIPGQREWGTRKIAQKELKDPYIRQIVENKLGKSIELNC